MSLSGTIRLLRQKALLNQKEFASLLHVSLVSVNRWESGKSIPNISAMKSIKTFCEENGYSYEVIEKEWLNSKMEGRR